MCLISKTWIPKITFKDIKVYKVVIQTSGNLVTPYLGYKVSKIMQTSFIDCIKGILNITYIYNTIYKINGGFIHSYKTLSDAILNCVLMQLENPDNECKILEGIIPKGSIYYESKTDICSNKLILDL